MWSFLSSTGEILANSQYSSPFFLMFKNSPDHSCLFDSRCHICWYSSVLVYPDFKIRGLFPIASSALYPVNLQKAGFTYSIVPLPSVITIEEWLCRTARC